jgi:arylsulfatase
LPRKNLSLYFAPGATHAPHQVDKEWSDKYRGKFDEGWDVYREKVLANQKNWVLYLPMLSCQNATN